MTLGKIVLLCTWIRIQAIFYPGKGTGKGFIHIKTEQPDKCDCTEKLKETNDTYLHLKIVALGNDR